jgi:cellulase/cellobiase CelA1
MQRIAEINQETTHSLFVPMLPNSCPATNHESTKTLVASTHPSSNATTNHDPTHNIVISIEPNSLLHEEDDNHNVVEGKWAS